MKYLQLHIHAFTHIQTYTRTHTHTHTHTLNLTLLYIPSYSPSLPSSYTPCRNIESDLNVFQGLVGNPIFVGILMFTVVAQYGLVEFGGAFVRTVRARK